MGQAGSKTSDSNEATTTALTWMQPDRNGLPPTPRNGHTVDLIGSKMYIFGGGDKADLLNELYVFDVHDHMWSQPPCTGIVPPPRSRHTSAVCDKRLLIWGGIGGGLDVHILDTETMNWTVPNAHGSVPESRFGHTSTTVSPMDNARLIILGGHNSRSALSDVHVLDVDPMMWETPDVTGIAPVCGNRHASVLLEDKASAHSGALLVFAADMHEAFHTLYALRFKANEPRMNWVELATNGAAPVSRSRPCAVRLGTEVFLLCGVAAGKPLNSVAMLDTKAMRWSSPQIEGIPPPPRMGAGCTLVGTDLYLFGGSDGKTSLRDLHVLVYVTWFAPAYKGRAPEPRVGHTCTSVGNRLFLLGGASTSQAHNDLYVLDPATQVWSRPAMYGNPPGALVGHSAVLVGTELFVWGGGDSVHAHNGLNLIDCNSLLWNAPGTSGNEPMARVGHSAVHTGTKMIVFGGYGHRQYWNELVMLDTGIMTWIRPHTAGHSPQPSVLHSATIVQELMVIVGGALDEQPLDQIVALDLVDLRWSRLGYNWHGPRPPPRFGHAAAAIGSRMFIFGGTGGVQPAPWYHFAAQALASKGDEAGYAQLATQDLQLIDFAHRAFSKPRYAGSLPAPTYRHTMTPVRGKLFVFGGVGSRQQGMKMLDTGLNIDAELPKTGGGGDEDDEAEGEDGDPHGRGRGLIKKSGENKGLEASAAAAVVALLQEIGLNKYARIFLKQEVDLDSLLQFSDQDLKDIGVVAIGARRKLTAAIHRSRLRQMRSPVDDAYSADSATAKGKDHDLVRQMFRGRYKLTGRTYLGGSALVKMATDEKTGGDVAIKLHARSTYFARELKYLRLLRADCVVGLLDHYEDGEPALVLVAGTLSLSEYLKQAQLSALERKHALERLVHILEHLHSKQLVAIDLKPHNLVLFGSLLSIKLIDLECIRKVGEQLPFKLTPYYAAPELAAAALETMRVGGLPEMEWQRLAPESVLGAMGGGSGAAAAAAATGEEGEGGGEPPRAGGPSSGAPGKSDKWGPNLAKLALLSEHPTLAKAVAVASQAAAKAGDPAKSVLSEQEQTMLDGILRTAAGKPLRASPAMDVWALGMILWELFTNEPFFAGCSDDVVLQVLATTTPLDVPQSRIYDVQAQHLLMKILSKRPKERCGLSDVLKHAFLQGGLDTREVADSFAKLHDGQQNFKQALEELHPEGAQAVARHNAAEQARKQAQQQGNGAGAGAGGGAGIGPSAADPASPPPAAMQRRGSTLSDKRAQIAQRRASASPGDSLPGAAQLPDGDLRV